MTYVDVWALCVEVAMCCQHEKLRRIQNLKNCVALSDDESQTSQRPVVPSSSKSVALIRNGAKSITRKCCWFDFNHLYRCCMTRPDPRRAPRITATVPFGKSDQSSTLAAVDDHAHRHRLSAAAAIGPRTKTITKHSPTTNCKNPLVLATGQSSNLSVASLCENLFLQMKTRTGSIDLDVMKVMSALRTEKGEWKTDMIMNGYYAVTDLVTTKLIIKYGLFGHGQRAGFS